MSRKAPKQQEYSKLAVQSSEDDESDAGPVQHRKRPTAIPATTTSTTSTHLGDEDDLGTGDGAEDDGDERFDMFFQQRRRTGALFVVAVAFMTVLFLLIVYLVVRRNQIKNALEATTRSWRDAFPDEVVSMMDQDVDPCDDFYQFSCGKWMQESEIPPEKSSVYASFTTVQDRNEAVLRDIMAENWPFLGELYNSCMNMSAINATGIAPLQKGLERLAGVKSKEELFILAGELAKTGPDFLTGLAVSPDAKDATKYVLYASQSGLTLPNRDYYLDAKKRNDTLSAYREFITAMFELTGHSQPDATRSDVLVVDFESELAKVFVPKEELTDPTKTYNVVKISDAMARYPLLFAAYMNGTGILDMHANGNGSSLATVVIETPSFFEAAEELVAETDLTTLRTAVTFQYVQHFAPTLTEPFISAAFAFFKKKLSGQQERSPRWKVCLRQATSFFPNLVGKYYFIKQFDVKSEVRANELVTMLEAAMRKRLTKVQWLDAATRAAALKKLALVTNLIGHSAKQERFPFVLSPEALSTNIQILSQYQFERAVNKIGKTVDRDEWYMTAADVNAYYNPAGNQIVFPAGILQPPFFSSQFPAARNFGAIGSIIGHELTHGFDSQGRNYDGDGNMVGWWTDATKQEFDRRAKCLVDQYDAFPVVSAFDANRVLGHVNGNFTLGENIADNGGVKLAFNAFQKLQAGEDGERGQSGGLTGESRASSSKTTGTNTPLSASNAQKLFFVAFAQAFCAKSSDEAMVRRLSTDPHSPERWRVNGVMRNSDDFSKTFECPRGASMNPEAKCKLW